MFDSFFRVDSFLVQWYSLIRLETMKAVINLFTEWQRKGAIVVFYLGWGREASHNGKVNFSIRMRMYKVSWNYIDFFFFWWLKYILHPLTLVLLSLWSFKVSQTFALLSIWPSHHVLLTISKWSHLFWNIKKKKSLNLTDENDSILKLHGVNCKFGNLRHQNDNSSNV